jgi:hypothetical protein
MANVLTPMQEAILAEVISTPGTRFFGGGLRGGETRSLANLRDKGMISSDSYCSLADRDITPAGWSAFFGQNPRSFFKATVRGELVVFHDERPVAKCRTLRDAELVVAGLGKIEPKPLSETWPEIGVQPNV